MKIFSFKYFDTFFCNNTSDNFKDNDTVDAGNQGATSTLRIQLHIKAASNTILDSKLAEAKTAIELKYLKEYKVFSDEAGQERTIYIRFVMRFKDTEMDKSFFDDMCQESINDFSSTAAGGWITHLLLSSCTSDATQPCILCLLVNLGQEFEDSVALKTMLQEITGNDTIGIKFNTYNGPKALSKKIKVSDWSLKKVLQVEGERRSAMASTKAIENYFKSQLFLGSRVQVVNVSKSKWASSAKGKKAFLDGMNIQVALNDKLLSYDLDDVNVFGKVTIGRTKRYLLDIMMSLKSKTPVIHSKKITKKIVSEEKAQEEYEVEEDEEDEFEDALPFNSHENEAIELSGDEESSEEEEEDEEDDYDEGAGEDYGEEAREEYEEEEKEEEEEEEVPPPPKSPPKCKSTATSKRSASERSPKSSAAARGRRNPRRCTSAAQQYHE
ncbi:predicted protein [Chaetoceros tenuissimus]|uniref:Uncharacterized protein n=1 Tax=Chaetoceros tenuissimus TaxID=426638 RepID=A0AAD3D7X8_9STRA|nr:predicted protein [Chaetoceros tenuissimus]